MTTTREFNLKSNKDVLELGAEVGAAAAGELLPLVASLDADRRFVFYVAYLSAFAGSMAAAGGTEMSLAALDRIKQAVPLGVAAGQADEAKAAGQLQ